MDQQLKKAEAAQKRRMQVEKAARESEVCFYSFQITAFVFILSNYCFCFYSFQITAFVYILSKLLLSSYCHSFCTNKLKSL